MKEKEILEMQRLIDEGVRKAQYRLWQRAGAARQSLIVCREDVLQQSFLLHHLLTE